MFSRKLVDHYNSELLKKHSAKEFFFQGYFNGNHMMFVGICPNLPSHESKFYEDMIEVQKDQTKYEQKLSVTPLGLYLKSIASSTRHISFTNLIKEATKDYETMTAEKIEEYKAILLAQIKLCNPNVVLIMGKFVGEKFGLTNNYEVKKIDGTYFMLIPHHAFVFRSENSGETIANIRKRLNEFFKMKGIVKISNTKIAYRDVDFNKQQYFNAQSDAFVYVKSDTPTEYKSFTGNYLQKIKKTDAWSIGMKEDTTFEGHLSKKDLFYYENIKEIQHSKCLRVCYIDIETDFCNDVVNTPKPITSISWHDNLTQKYYCMCLKHNETQQLKREHKADVKLYDSERIMLESFLRILQKYDVVTGWYSNGFDMPYIINRGKVLGLDMLAYFSNLGLKMGDDKKLRIYQDTIVMFDCKEFYQKNAYYSKPKSYSLKDVSEYIFGKKYQKIAIGKIDEVWRTDLDSLVEYNINDVLVLKMIADEVNAISYPISLQQLCPQDFENMFYNSRTIENMLHQMFWQQGIRFPTKRIREKREFIGGKVFDPIEGIHKNVAVYDFAAMYTNIILSHNFSPDVLVGEKAAVENNFEAIKSDLIRRYDLKEKLDSFNKEDFVKACICVENDFGTFLFLPKSIRVGILAQLELYALSLRKTYIKMRDSQEPNSMLYQIYDEQQGIAKQILNSVYGITSYEKFIMFEPIVSSSIASTARQLLFWCRDVLQKMKFESISGDTDSNFVRLLATLTATEAIELGKDLEAKINATFKDFMRQRTTDEVTINSVSHSVAFEKLYSKLRLVKVKKRYFGWLSYYKGKKLEKEKFSTVGFETRKDSTPHYFKKKLEHGYQLLLEDDYDKKLKEEKKHIIEEIKTVPVWDLVMKYKISRNMELYKNLPIHIRAVKNANMVLRRGDTVNMIYVKGLEVLHYDPDGKQTFVIDYDRYVEKQYVEKLHLIDEWCLNYQTQLAGWC